MSNALDKLKRQASMLLGFVGERPHSTQSDDRGAANTAQPTLLYF